MIEIVVNDIDLLLKLRKGGFLSEDHNFKFIVHQNKWEKSDRIDQLYLDPYINKGIILIDECDRMNISEVFILSDKYSLLKYTISDFMSIQLCLNQGNRLLSENLAIRKIAQKENIEIISYEQITQVIIRKISYVKVLK
ncbi:hypothetical protein [Marinigracilibium pacificum]|uniref:Uncharacterized protein n=1 Tax=Marinigracilibium pacificum TaxID=2729599 RepID=A0A848J3L9_9BACT|nr:hypothetical protein [Marinigracilibium pacificum]NMM50321.1 hypothetical protein [Marinigracilibium pacificum]